MSASLYYEAHVTLDPVFGTRRREAEVIAQHFYFRLAELILRKEQATPELPALDDTFMTGRSHDRALLTERMKGLITALRSHNFVVRRYKIEDTLVDSKIDDCLRLLPRKESPNG